MKLPYQPNSAAVILISDGVMRPHKQTGFGQEASTKVANYFRRLSWLAGIGFVFLCALPCHSHAQAQLDGNDIPAVTARTVLGIVSYSRWPVQPEFYRFCIVGDQTNIHLLTEHSNEVAGREVRVRMPKTDTNEWLAECDVLYLGAMEVNQRLAILKKIKQETILTIGEGDEMCSDGMMFCFGAIGQQSVLHANLDAIARSSIRINANVLLLLRHKDTQP